MTDWFDGGDILRGIREESAARRAAPREFFQTFLQEIWMDNTEDEAFIQWQVKVDHFPWYADDALRCVERMLDEPPDDVKRLMQEDGWIMLFHPPETPGGYEPEYSATEYREWLRVTLARLRQRYDDAPGRVSQP